MNLLRRLFAVAVLRLKSIFRKGKVETELDRELRFHLHEQTQEYIASGIDPDRARDLALRNIGGIAQVQETCRDMRRTNHLETLWLDLRYAVRTLGRTPGFTGVLVLTMALAIGANSAIFSVVQGVLLRALPYPNPDRLVRIYFQSDSQPKFPLNPYDLRDFRERNQTFESMAAIVRDDAQLSGDGSDPIKVNAFYVTAGYFSVLGLSPEMGREFNADDELPNHGRSAIISNRLWRNRFGSDRGIIGRDITIDAMPCTVVGVMPAGAQHPGNTYHALTDGESVDIWRPFTFDGKPENRGSHYMDGFGRLKPGITPAQGNADLSAILTQLMNEHTGKGWRVYLVPLYQETVGRTKQMLLVLLGAVGLLLLIACVNAANLLLARSSARVREIAIRSALGAARGRIVRQLLTESLAIAIAGGALGTLLAVGGVRLLVAYLPAGFPRASEIKLDSGVFGFTLLVAVITGLLFGLVPAFTASRTDLQLSLHEGGRGTTGGRQLRLRNILVVGETGLACVLLIGAGLMLHSFVNLLRTDPGFRPQQVLTASLALPQKDEYKTSKQVLQFYQNLERDMQSKPGVQSVGLGSDLPWTGYDENIGGFPVEGRTAEYNQKTTARYHGASPDYFRALGIPLLEGRFFTASDDDKATSVVIVNQTMAKRYWPDQDAVGKRISFNDPPTEKDWITIVGVVEDIKDQPDNTAARPAFWWPIAQVPSGNMCVAVRSSSNPATVAGQLRESVHQLDSGLAIGDQQLMSGVFDAALSSQRFALFLVALFAVLAMILATIGVYGVISYSVNQRMHEFGVRMALGARPSGLMRLILVQGLRLSAIGAATGLVLAVGLSRLMSALLYGVGGKDPVTFVAVGLLVLLITTVACYVPARRASYADPTQSLRSE